MSDKYCIPHAGTHVSLPFKVPLDYSDPEGEQAAVAMLKVPASVSSDSDLYRGPVLFNPGRNYSPLFHSLVIYSCVTAGSMPHVQDQF